MIPMRTSTLAGIATAWFAIALALGAAGVVEKLRPPIPQLILLGLTALPAPGARCLTVISRGHSTSTPARWSRSISRGSSRAGISSYCTIAGKCPIHSLFPLGWGDIATAILALILLLAAKTERRTGLRLYVIWNVFGLIDILAVVGNAATTAIRDPESMRALLQLPCSLLPTFLVPIIIVSHIVLFLILSRAGVRPAFDAPIGGSRQDGEADEKGHESAVNHEAPPIWSQTAQVIGESCR